jgi:O-antigen biosynthesis protein
MTVPCASGTRAHAGPRCCVPWEIEPPPSSRGAWNRIVFHVAGTTEATLLVLVMRNEQGVAPDSHFYLPPGLVDGEWEVFTVLPSSAGPIRLIVTGSGADKVQVTEPRFIPVNRLMASARLLASTPPGAVLAAARRGFPHPAALLRSLRATLAETARTAYQPPKDYRDWIRLFDSWSAADFLPESPRASIGYVVFAEGAAPAALTASLTSIDAQPQAPARLILSRDTSTDGLAAWLNTQSIDYVGLLEAGEVLPSHAGWLAGEKLLSLGCPEIAVTDEDELREDGERQAPRFMPMPSHVAMLSGLPARGFWLVARRTLQQHLPAPTPWAEAFRLDLWLRRYQASPNAFSARIPFILCHRRADTPAAPADVLASIVEGHLEQTKAALTCASGRPLKFSLRQVRAPESVTILIPSTLRQQRSLSCIGAVLSDTDYPSVEVRVVVMQREPLDAAQRAAANRLAADSRVTVQFLQASAFNFSTASNHAASGTQSEHLLLLNDDVRPIKPDWLRWMTAFMADPQVGVVGARLLYPDDRVQHGGVILGLAGLCDHAHRFLPREERGYMSRAVIAQEMSAVTGACMLVRRALFEHLGGLDESYPSAFNDVDLALRVREAGHSIVYAAQAELYHHELQTYGDHYDGERKASQNAEVARMRRRWAHVIAADPFHNPNLSLVPRMEWNLAFPPQLSPWVSS